MSFVIMCKVVMDWNHVKWKENTMLFCTYIKIYFSKIQAQKSCQNLSCHVKNIYICVHHQTIGIHHKWVKKLGCKISLFAILK